MVSKNELFEIHLCRDGRWTIDATSPNQGEAEAVARKGLNREGVSAARVVRTVERGGTARETVVFERTRQVKVSDKVFVDDIEDAPACETAEELYALQGRATINRLFRTYLDRRGVTASEVMHDFRELRRALDADTLVSSGIGKVATLQARSGNGMSAVGRRDALFGFVDKVTERAKAAADRKLPAIKDGGFDRAVTRIRESAPEADRDFLLRVVVARDLIQERSYFGKLAKTVEWAEPAGHVRATDLLDTYVSDILASATTLQDLLGDQPNLAGALASLIDLTEGCLEVDVDGAAEDSPEVLADRLNGLMAADGLPDSRSILLDRVRRQISGRSTFGSGDPGQEAELFHGLIDKLMPRDAIVGGSSMAEAFTHRQSRLINKGGAAGLKAAASSLLPVLNDPLRKASYLLSLGESGLAESLNGEIETLLEGLFVTPQSVKQIVRDDRPPNKKMQIVTAVFQKIQASTLSQAMRDRITGRLDELLASYILDDRILERVDDPSRPLHIRAFMLLSMCTPEMLPEGKASALARKIVLRHLRRPDFETELVAGVPAEEKERVLRDFHVQLHRCGFMG